MNDLAKELRVNRFLSLNDELVRNLAGINSGSISLNDLKGKRNTLFFSAVIKPGYKITRSDDSMSEKFRKKFESRGIYSYLGLHSNLKPDYDRGDFGEVVGMIREIEEISSINDDYELSCIYSKKTTRIYDGQVTNYKDFLFVEASVSDNDTLEDVFEVKTNKSVLKIFIDNKLIHLEQIYDYSFSPTNGISGNSGTFEYKIKRDEILYPDNLYQVFEKNTDKEITVTICLS